MSQITIPRHLCFEGLYSLSKALQIMEGDERSIGGCLDLKIGITAKQLSEMTWRFSRVTVDPNTYNSTVISILESYLVNCLPIRDHTWHA